MGADIVVAVNLLNRQAPTACPSEVPPMPAFRSGRSRPVDPVIETLMMLQIDASVRTAGEADIVIAPGFAATSWRDFHLSELFRAAGREAAESQIARLEELAGPGMLPARACDDRARHASSGFGATLACTASAA